MEYIFRQKNKKIKDRLSELENELTILNTNVQNIMRKCFDMIQGLKSPDSLNVFMAKYASSDGYISHCTALVSAFNCKLEILLLPDRADSENSPFFFICEPESFQVGNCSDVTATHHVHIQDDNGKEQENHSDVPPGNSPSDSSFTRTGARLGTPRTFPAADSPPETGQDKIGNQSGWFTPSRHPSPVIPTETPVLAPTKSTKPACLVFQTLPYSAPGLPVSRSPSPAETKPIFIGENKCPDAVTDHIETKNQNTSLEKSKPGDCQPVKPFELNMTKGSRFKMSLSHQVSPATFYGLVHCKKLKPIDVMQREINNHIAGKGSITRDYHNSSLDHATRKKLARKALDSYVVGFVEDLSSWIRLRVLDWRLDQDDDLIRAFYIDYGKSVNISLTWIQPMDQVIRSYPQFCFKFYLAGICPVNPCDPSGAWSEEDSTVFELFLESAKDMNSFEIEVAELERYSLDQSVGVRLFLEDSMICINDKLIEFQVAAPTDSASKSADSNWALKSVLGNVQPSESSVPTSTDKSGRCCGDEECRGTFSKAFSIGDSVHVRLTCLTKVNRFFCVLDHVKMKQTDVLRCLISILNEPSNVAQMTPVRDPPKAGDLIVGKYEDGNWYRAKVIRYVSEIDQYKVIFLDYGNKENIDMKDMRKMEKRYLQYPFQMIECHLEDVVLSRDVERQDAVQHLLEAMQGEVTIRVTGILDASRAIYSVDAYGKDGRNIVTDLVTNNYALLRKKNK